MENPRTHVGVPWTETGTDYLFHVYFICHRTCPSITAILLPGNRRTSSVVIWGKSVPVSVKSRLRLWI